MYPRTESTKPSVCHSGIRKRPRYLTSWEESFRRIPHPQKGGTELSPSLWMNDINHNSNINDNDNINSFGLIDLFGGNRWVQPRETGSVASSKALNHETICGFNNTIKHHHNCNIHSDFSINTPSKFFTLRMEHRKGGTLAKYVGEERILLFRSDQAGAIAKIIFSSSPVLCDSGEFDNSLSRTANHQYQHINKGERTQMTISANAKVHVLFVKDAYRGFNLGGLLFVMCTNYLRERYCHRIDSSFKHGLSSAGMPSIRCQLDAEEDIRRHDKLVHFYEHLGLRKRIRAKPTLIHNNDGETYHRIPMRMDLTVASSCKTTNEQPSNYYQVHVAKTYSSFLPALLVSAFGDNARVDGRSIDSWLIVEYQDGIIELRTTDGCVLRHDGQGRCKLEPFQSLSSNSNSSSNATTSASFQLLRVSDMLEKVLLNREEECSCTQDDKSLCSHPKNEMELWMLRSSLHGTFLGMTSDRDLVVSPEASFWQADENFCLSHTSDSPARRQHHRRMWKTQSVSYVSEMRDKHCNSGFALCTMTIKEALDATQYLLANPFSMSGGGRTMGSLLPSVRTLLFHTAELARKEGHPDWVQFVALVYGLAGALTCERLLSNSSSSGSGGENGKVDDDDDDDDGGDFAFDWTIYVDARVMGCKDSKCSTFHEFRHLNPDRGDARYNTTNGMYPENVGLEHVFLSWTSNDYMHHMLKHNGVRLPKEAYAILRLFPLVDWHTRGKHTSLSNETDEELKPFVADFYELFQRSRDSILMRSSSTEKSETECKELWTNHYSLIATKYGAGGILEW